MHSRSGDNAAATRHTITGPTPATEPGRISPGRCSIPGSRSSRGNSSSRRQGRQACRRARQQHAQRAACCTAAIQCWQLWTGRSAAAGCFWAVEGRERGPFRGRRCPCKGSSCGGAAGWWRPYTACAAVTWTSREVGAWVDVVVVIAGTPDAAVACRQAIRHHVPDSVGCWRALRLPLLAASCSCCPLLCQ